VQRPRDHGRTGPRAPGGADDLVDEALGPTASRAAVTDPPGAQTKLVVAGGHTLACGIMDRWLATK
jgi:hypothetical protein